MKRPSRLLLVVLLLPVLLLGAWLAEQDIWLPVWNWDVSPDGSQLVAIISHLDARRETTSVQLWDLRSRRRMASRQGDARRAFFSPDGRTIVTGHDKGAICVREAGTLAERMRFSINAESRPIAFVGDEATLLVWTRAPQLGAEFRLVRINHEALVGRAIEYFHPSVSADGQTLLDIRSSKSGQHAFAAFRFSRGELRKIAEFDSAELIRSHALSPDGRYAAIGLAEKDIVQLWNLSTGTMEREIRQPDYSDYTFVDNGRLLAISSRPEHAWLWTVQLWNVKGGGPVGAWRTLWEPDLHLAPYHAFHDFRVTFFRFAPITVRHLKTGEILATLPMRAGAYYAVALVECLLLIAWSVAWVRSGRRSRTPHPLLDAAFVHGVVTLVLAARLLTTASPHLVREMTGCLLCTELVAVSCLAAMWAAASDHRCMLRVSTALAAVTGATAAMVNPHFTLWRDHWDWDYVFASVALAICLACGVLGWRRLGVRVAPAPSVGRRDRGVRGSRVMLRDLFVFMAAIAACLAVVRFFKPSDYLRLWDGSMAGNPMFVASFYRWRLTKVSYLACEGVMFAIAAAAGAWFALAPSRWLLRAMVVILACLTTELPWWFFQKVLSLESWWQHLAAHSLVAVIVATILLVFRFHGYRIRMGAAEPCAERGAAS